MLPPEKKNCKLGAFSNYSYFLDEPSNVPSNINEHNVYAYLSERSHKIRA